MDSCLSASINFAYVGKNIIDLGRVGRKEGGTRARRDKLLFVLEYLLSERVCYQTICEGVQLFLRESMLLLIILWLLIELH